MRRSRKLAALFVACSVLGAVWFTESRAGEQKKADPEAAQLSAIFEKLKGLVGEWVAVKPEKAEDKGKVVLRYRLTGGGSALSETIFPDSDMEMLSVYHRDGGQLVMTHFCCVGNQPKFRARPGKDKNEVIFEFVGGTNLNPAKDGHIHGGVIRFTGPDQIRSEWEFYSGGKLAEKHGFDLIRKK
jgi:hypothetical protein